MSRQSTTENEAASSRSQGRNQAENRQINSVESSETDDPEAKKQLQARSHLFTPRPGFSYHYVLVQYQKGAKFGLVIKSSDNRVYVSRLDPKSICADRLQVGDHIIDVDGTLITDREIAKKLMLKRLAATRKVSFIVERPISSEAKLWVKTVLLSASTRTSSTAPREKATWASKAAQQRESAKRQNTGLST